MESDSGQLLFLNNYDNNSSEVYIVNKDLAELLQQWNITNFCGVLQLLQCKFVYTIYSF